MAEKKIYIKESLMTSLITLCLYSSAYTSYEREEEEKPYFSLSKFISLKNWLQSSSKSADPLKRNSSSLSHSRRKESTSFIERGRVHIEKQSFLEHDFQEMINGSFILNQDTELHYSTDLNPITQQYNAFPLKSLSIFDCETGLTYIKEEGIGKRGNKKIIYFDPQADVPYWKKGKEWQVQVPYAFGYTKESYKTRRALEKRLEGLFETRLKSYHRGAYEVFPLSHKGFSIQRREGLIFKNILESREVHDIYAVHRFFLDQEPELYTSYLYGKETSSWKSLSFLALLVGAEIIEGMNVQKLIFSSQTEETAGKGLKRASYALTAGEIGEIGEIALLGATALAAPQWLPFYLLLKLSKNEGVAAAFQQKDMICKEGVCSDGKDFFESSSQSSKEDPQFCEALMKNITNFNMNDDFMKVDGVPCLDNVVYLLGNTRVGKGVFSNYLAGREITAIKNGLDVEVNVNNPITGVGHGVGSHTFEPVLWKSDDFCFYDTAGLGETRGPDHDIIKSYYLKHLGNSAKSLRLVLVAEQDSLPGAATGFINLMKSFEKLVGEEGVQQLQEATTLIITKSTSPMKDIFAQITKINNNPEAHFSDEIKTILTHLLEKKAIYPFEKIEPDSSGKLNVALSPQEYLNIIGETTPVSNENRGWRFWVPTTKKPTFNMVVSAETSEIISRCSQIANKEIVDSINTISNHFEHHYASIIRENPLNATTVSSWHSLFYTKQEAEVTRAQELGNMFEDLAETLGVKDWSDRNTTYELQVLDQKIRYLDLLRTFPAPTQYAPSEWIKGMRGLTYNLNQCAQLYDPSTSTLLDNNILYIKGYFPSLDEIENQIKLQADPDKVIGVRIYGLHTFGLDGNFTRASNLEVIAPFWKTNDLKHVSINLAGKAGEKHEQANAPQGTDGIGRDGSNGLPGRPGKSGGNLVVIGNQFIDIPLENLKNLTSLKGGKGGPGQAGGKGGKGKSGSPNFTPSKMKSRFKKKDCLDYNWCGSFNCLDSSHVHGTVGTLCLGGEEGQAGGNGGKGGKGGEGGQEGKLLILSLKDSSFLNKTGETGANGLDGKPGEGGEGGECTLKRATYKQEGVCDLEWGSWCKTGWYDVWQVVNPNVECEAASSGTTPTELNDENKEVASSLPSINLPALVQQYTHYARDVLLNLGKEEYKNNLLIQAHKEVIGENLENILNHPEVKKK